MGFVRDHRNDLMAGFVRYLQRSVYLGERVRLWRGPEDLQALSTPPSKNQLPAVALWWYPAAATPWVQSDMHAMPVTVGLRTWTSSLSESIDLWGAIQSSLYPQEPAERDQRDAALAELGISNVSVLQPAWGFADPAAAGLSEGVVASVVGHLQLDVWEGT